MGAHEAEDKRKYVAEALGAGSLWAKGTARGPRLISGGSSVLVDGAAGSVHSLGAGH